VRLVALLGNPNVGKTSLFNVLTGSRHRVGNYAGVTVERLEGELAPRFSHDTTHEIRLVDMPGCYSLTATSTDEAAAVDLLDGRVGQTPSVVVVVVDATNLSRNLYMVLQARERATPVVVALNMSDMAAQIGMPVDARWLSDRLGVPVVATSGRTGEGARELAIAIDRASASVEPGLVAPEASATALREVLRRLGGDGARARWVLCTAAAGSLHDAGGTAAELAAVEAIEPDRLAAAAIAIVELRYREVDRILATRPGGHAASADAVAAMATSERIDAWLTHRVWGLLVFASVMTLVFAAVFSGAEPFIGAIEELVAWLSEVVGEALGPGILGDLVTKGVISGVGNVIVFVPQIALLFALISVLEDSGYLARAAFLMDRLMARLGLHGRAFIPLLSGFACAVPSILGTRTISSFKDRVVTILMIPYVSCSARLPIYSLVIGALLVTDEEGGTWQRTGIMLAMYALSTCSALAVGFIAKRTILRSPTPPLVLELPPYRLPRLRNTALVVYDRTMDFVRNAGTVILACTIVLWALLSFPREDTGAGGEGPTRIAESYGGKAAQVVEPALEPIGQDWRMGIGILGSFAAREVLVGTLGLVYGLEAEDDDAPLLREAIRNDVDEQTGAPRHTPLSGLALMVFFVYACQCMSTLAAVRRETASWRWTAFVFFSMTAVAYVAALVVYQGGRILGFG
jgi:ferrous iron transport protein B